MKKDRELESLIEQTEGLIEQSVKMRKKDDLQPYPYKWNKLLPDDPKARKEYPVGTGCLDYFSDALVCVSNVSYVGNRQHNPDSATPFWARGKSMDQEDCIIRHYIDRGTLDSDGIRHTAKMAWRALAMLQLELEAELSLKPSRASKLPDGNGGTENG